MSTQEESIDPRMVEQAHQQIRGLMDEIVALARQDIPPEAFYTEYLSRVVSALAAVGGAVWRTAPDGSLEVQSQLNFQERGLSDRPEDVMGHRTLLSRVFSTGEGWLADPRYAGADGQGVNPTDYLLVLAPVKLGNQTKNVVEIFQRPIASIKTQRGYLRFLLQMSDLATDYLKNRELRTFGDRQSMWQQLEQFTRAVHDNLDPHAVSFTIANEGRRLIGCDRVTVALQRGRKCRIEAISGQDTFDARSNTVSLLGELANVVLHSGEPVWYEGDTRDLPPQIEAAVQDYVDDSHSKHVAVLPLRRPPPPEGVDEKHVDSSPIGALIIERIEDTRPKEGMLDRIHVVAEHSAVALANAQEHENLFLMPLWRTIGKSRVLVEARNLPKTVLAVVLAVGLIIALFVVPYDFSVHSGGTLQPLLRRDVFANLDGTVDEILVKHGQKVKADEIVANLRNTDLDVAIEKVNGEINATREQLNAVERGQRDIDPRKPNSREERDRLAGERAQLVQKLESLKKQSDLYILKKAKLAIHAPIAGEITTWNVENLLNHRPVRQGQVLMSVADESGDWELELRVPEDRMGYIAEARAALKKESPDKDLTVTFRLATNPGVDFEGTIKEISSVAEVHGEEGNTVLVRVAIDKNKLAEVTKLQPGADCIAKIHCGKESLGYAIFHDPINFVRTKILFRL
jgi:multidrug efflux pump subunit AcrA (membrane-fusion protein)